MSRALYLGLILLVAIQRLAELRLARCNARRLLAVGAVEHGRRHYPVMVVLHTLFLLACPAEVWLLDRPLLPRLAGAMLLALAGATALRYWAITSLGERWTTRVLVRPAAALVPRGPYRYLRHPNYLAVVLEIAALPLVHGAWLTAVVFSVANAALLTVRIRAENAALERHAAP